MTNTLRAILILACFGVQAAFAAIGQVCIEPPAQGSAKSIPQLPAPVMAGEIAIIDVNGAYDRGLLPIRQGVNRSLLTAQNDDFDFVFVFSTFEYPTGDALAFFNPVFNDVSGNGSAPVDVREGYGSQKLLGYIDMAAMSRHQFNRTDPAFKQLLNTMAHELMHQYGSYARFRSLQGAVRSDLLGAQGAHWSALAGTDASLMYGADWQPRSQGGFQALAVEERYGWLDMYLAGWANAGEVAPTKLFPSGLEPAGRVAPGTILTSAPEDVSLAQIIAAEGERTPSAAQAQRQYRAAFVLLKRPADIVAPAQVQQLEQLRGAFADYFTAITRGRAQIRIDSSAKTIAPTVGIPIALPASVVPGYNENSPPPGLPAALNWLRLQQLADGHFADRPESTERDTVLAAIALSRLDPGGQALARARSWLAGRLPGNTDSAFWLNAADIARAAALQQVLNAAQDDLGPTRFLVGPRRGYAGSPVDQAHALALLASEQPTLRDRLSLNYQISDAVAATELGRPRVWSTGLSAGVLQRAGQSTDVARLRAWLIARQVASGGLSDDDMRPDLFASMTVLRDAFAIGLPTAPRLSLGGYVRDQQGRDGDWRGSVAMTATAILSLVDGESANLTVGAISADPLSAVDGQRVRLSVRVRNVGAGSAPATSARFYLGAPDQGGTPLGLAIPVSALAAGAEQQISVLWDTRNAAGARTVYAVADPDNTVAESVENDNSAALSYTVLPPPSSPDLAVFADETTITPSVLTELPSTVTVRTTLHNLGTTALSGTTLALYQRTGTQRTLLASTQLDVAGRASIPAVLTFQATLSQTLELSLIADPDNAITEANEANNEVPLRLSFGDALDLSIVSADVTVVPAQPVDGDNMILRATIRNLGASNAPTAVVAAQVTLAGNTLVLIPGAVTVSGGQSAVVDFPWRAEGIGSAQLRVEVDPGNQIAETREDNNLATRDVVVGIGTEPNLQITAGSIALAPLQPLEGQPLMVTATVRNVGAAAAGASRAALFAGDPRTGGILLSTTAVASVPGRSNLPISFSVADLTQRGNTTFYVLADDQNIVAERDESDNFAVLTRYVRSLPDLYVDLASIALTPFSPVVGQSVSARITLRNLGEQAASAFVVQSYEGPPGSGVVTGPPIAVNGMPAGGETEVSATWTFGLSSAQNLYSVALDSASQVREITEANNAASIPVNTQNADRYLTERYISPNGDGVQDDTRFYFQVSGSQTVIVRNALQHEVRHYDFPAGNPSALFDGRDDDGDLLPDGNYTIDLAAGGSVPLDVRIDTNRLPILDVVGTPLYFLGTGEGEHRDAIDDPYWYTVKTYGQPGDYYNAVARKHVLGTEFEQLTTKRMLDQAAAELGVFAIGLNSVVPMKKLGIFIAYALIYRTATTQPHQAEPAQFVIDLNGGQRFRRIVLPGRIAQQVENDRLLMIDGGPNDQLLYVHDLIIGSSTAPVNIGRMGVVKYFDDGLVMQGTDFPCELFFLRLSDGTIVESNAPCFSNFGLGAETSSYISPNGFVIDKFEIVNLRTGVRMPCCEGYSSEYLSYSWSDELDQFVAASAVERRLIRIAENGELISSVDLPYLERTTRVGGRNGFFRSFLGSFEFQSELYGPIQVPGLYAIYYTKMAHRAGSHLRAGTPKRSILFPLGEVHEYCYSNFACGGGETGSGFYPGNQDYYLVDEANNVKVADRFLAPTDLYGGEMSLPWLVQKNGSYITGKTAFFQGSRIVIDGLVRASDGRRMSDVPALPVDESTWAEETRWGGASSLANGANYVTASNSGRGVRLSGFAQDINLAHFDLQWAYAQTPETWNVVMPPQTQGVANSEILTWAAPAAGPYRFRLRVRDRAGNQTESFTTGNAPVPSPIVDAVANTRLLSPNGDGVLDLYRLDFRVVLPVTTTFAVTKLDGTPVYSEQRSYGAADLGAQSWQWTGVNSQGVLVPDAAYRVTIDVGYGFPVTLDTTPPLHTMLVQDGSGVAQDLPISPFGEPSVADLRAGFGPSLRYRFGVAADRQYTPTIEVQQGGQWQSVATTRPRFSASGDGYLFLPTASAVGRPIRTVAVDAAGNRAVSSTQSLAPSLALIGTGRTMFNQLGNGFAPPFRCAPFGMCGDWTYLRFDEGREGIGESADFYAASIGNDYSELRLELADDTLTAPYAVIGRTSIFDGLAPASLRHLDGAYVSLTGDFSTIVPNARYRLRLVGQGPAGQTALTPRFFSVPGFNGLYFQRVENDTACVDFSATAALLPAPLTSPSIRLFNGDQVTTFPAQLDGAIASWDGRLLSGQSWQFTIRDRYGRLVESTKLTCPTDGDPETVINAKTTPIVSECGGAAPKRIRLTLIQPFIWSRLKVVAVQGNRTLVLHDEQYSSSTGDTFEFDLSAFNRGQLTLELSVQTVSGQTVQDSLLYFLETNPARPEIIEPASGRVCLDSRTSPIRANLLEGEWPLAWRFQTGRSAAGPLSCSDVVPNNEVPGRKNTVARFGKPACSAPGSDEALSDFSIGEDHDQFTLSDLPDLGVDQPVYLRMEATNRSGALRCHAVQFVADVAVGIRRTGLAQPLIVRAKPKRTYLSYDGDLDFQSTSVPFETDEALTATVELYRALENDDGPEAYGPALAQLAQLRPPLGSWVREWDGRIGGDPIADGLYAQRITARDDCGHEFKQDYFVVIDQTAPEVDFSSPADGAQIGAPAVEVRATVVDPHFRDWTLLFGLGETPSSWRQVASGTSAFEVAGVLGVVPLPAEPGPVSLRVVATDHLGNERDERRVIVVTARQPLLDGLSLSRAFSPNDDGVKDGATLRYELLQAARVTMLIKRDAAVVATVATQLQQAAGTHTLVWNGKDSNNNVVNDARYDVELTASKDNPSGSEQITLTTIVDTFGPVVSVVRPGNDTFIGCALGLAAMADDPLFEASRATLLDVAGDDVRTVERTSPGELSLGSMDGQPDGSYQVLVEASDFAGNRGTATNSFVLDCTAPEATITGPAINTLLRAGVSATIVGTARDENLVDYVLSVAPAAAPNASTPITTGTQSVNAANLATLIPTQDDGAYQLQLVVRDRAGNSARATQLVRIDKNPPRVLISSPTAGQLLRSQFSVMGTASDVHLTDYQVRIAPVSGGSVGQYLTLQTESQSVEAGTLAGLDIPGEGDFSLQVFARDEATRESAAEVQVRIDSTPPAAPVLSGQVESNRDARLSWAAVSAPDLAGYKLFREGRLLATLPTTPTSYLDRDVPDGRYRYILRAVDQAGNDSLPSNTVSLQIDRTPPLVSLSAPGSGERVRGIARIAGAVSTPDNDLARWDLSAQSLPTGTPQNLVGRTLPIDGELTRFDTRAIALETRVRLALTASDRLGNQATATREFIVDNEPPAAPINLGLVRVGRGIRATWTPNTEPDLLGYLLYRSGQLVTATGSLPDDLRPYTLTDANYLDGDPPDGELIFQAYAVDTAGNISLASDPAQLTLDQDPPDLDLAEPQPNTRFEQPIAVRAVSADLDVASVQFSYRRFNQAWQNLGAPVALEPWRVMFDPRALNQPYGMYELRAIGTDRGGRVDPAPPTVAVVYADLTPPPTPTSISATANGVDIAVSWPAVAAPDLRGYVVQILTQFSGWLDARPEQTGTGLTYTDPSGRYFPVYTFRVIAIDQSGNRSEPSPSDDANVFLPTAEQLYTPTLLATDSIIGRSSVAGVVSGTVSNGGTALPLSAVTATTDADFSMPVPLAVGTNQVVLRVQTATGDISRPLTMRIDRSSLPSAPTGLAATVSGNQVSTSFNSVPDALGYRLLANDTAADPDVAIVATANSDSDCCDAANAFDSNAATAWRPFAYGDGVEAFSALVAQWPTQQIVSRIELDWSSMVERSVRTEVQAWSGFAWVRIGTLEDQSAANQSFMPDRPYRTDRLRIVALQRTTPGQRFSLAELRIVARPLQTTTARVLTLLDGRYQLRAFAANDAGYFSLPSDAVPVDVGDIEPPLGVVLSGTTAGSTSQLSWTASASPDVTRYQLLRDGAPLTMVSAPTLTYADGPLANGRYRYRVIALDAANNPSPQSNEVTLDIAAQGPGVPEDVQVDARANGGALTVSWRAGPGATPTGYILRRGDAQAGPFAQIAAPTALSYLDQPLVNGRTYWYTVAATDGTNTSAPSAPVSGMPQDSEAPATPRLTFPSVTGVPITIAASTTQICGLGEPANTVDLRIDTNAPIASTSALASTRVTRAISSSYREWAVSPGGNSLLVREDGEAATLQDFSGNSVTLPRVGIVHRFDPAGDRVYSSRESDPRLLDVYGLDGALLNTINVALDIDDYAPSRDGKRFLLRSADSGTDALYLYDVALGSAQLINTPLTPNELSYARLAIADSGRRAAVRAGNTFVWVDLANTPSAQSLTTAGNVYVEPQFVPGSDDLLYHLDDNSAWLKPAGAPARQLVVLPTYYLYASPLPDGQRFVAWTNNRIGQIFSLQSGAPLGEINFPDGNSERHWLRSGHLVGRINGSTAVVRYGPPWQFCFANIALQQGRHLYAARASDANGNSSTWSAALDINLGQSTLPDLVIRDSDIITLPASAAPGSAISALLRVRNLGNGASAPTQLRLRIGGPALGPEQLLSVPALAAGANQQLSVALGSYSAAGVYVLDALVDPNNQVIEVNEQNNTGRGSFQIVSGIGPAINLSLAASVFAPDALVTGQVGVVVPSDTYSGPLRLSVVPATGNSTVLFTETITIGPNTPFARSLSWNAVGASAGDYRMRAELLNPQGVAIAERSVRFSISAQSQVSLSINSLQPGYQAGQVVDSEALANYLQGNQALAQSVLEITAVRPGESNPFFNAQRALGTLLPGYRLRMPTSLTLPSDAPIRVYALRAKLRSRGALIAQAETSFVVTGTQPIEQLLGTITAQPGLPVVLDGDAAMLRFAVRNPSATAIPALDARLQLLRTNGEVLGTVSNSSAIAAGGELVGTLDLAGLNLGIETLLARLEVRPAGSDYRDLARLSIAVVDGLPPDIVAVAPTAAPSPRPTLLRATVSDRHSAVDLVEAQLDSGSWLTLGDFGGSDYGRIVSGLADGTHSLVLRARDRYGNTRTLAPRSFEVDGTPPVITISGVSEGQVSRVDLTPVVSATDANLQRVDSTLNGVAWASGTVVSAEGSYVLRVVAIDTAGNRAERSLRFAIDRSAPTLSFVEPMDGASVELDRVLVRLQSEAAARVRLTVGAYSNEVMADALGLASFAAVPLAVGSNTLSATAEDGAGNTSAAVSITVTRLDNLAESLEGRVLPNAVEIAQGDVLDGVLELRNRVATARPGLLLRLRLLRDGALVDSLPYTVDLGASAMLNRSFAFATAQFTLGNYVLSFDVQDSAGAYQVLDSVAVAVVDRGAPEIVVLQPLAGALVQATAQVEARITDALSPIVSAELSLDGGSWIVLQPQSGNRYTATLSALSEGPHALRLRALDSYGNSALLEQSFVSDQTPPAITISGVTQDQLANVVLNPTYSAADLHLDAVSATLNGAPYASGAAISADGSYQLRVSASDRAGNSSEQTVSFAIDRTPPDIVWTTPSAGQVVLTQTITATGETEGLSSVELRTTGYTSTGAADAAGVWRFDAVPLVIGGNTLQARATDRAGNVGDWSDRLVTYRPNAGAQLSAALNHPATIAHGSVLRSRATVSNIGTIPATALRIRVQLERLSGSVLASEIFPVTLAPGASDDSDRDFPTAALVPADYIVRLDAELTSAAGDIAWATLTTLGVKVEDRDPPTVSIEAPAADSWHRLLVDVDIAADDVLSGIDLVEARLDDGAWIVLGVTRGQRYTGSLPTSREGVVVLQARATDGAGNQQLSSIRSIRVDRTPPVIQILDVPSAPTNQVVTPRLLVDDASPTTTVSTLNGAPFVFGSTIEDSGWQRLVVNATDAAGNTSTAEARFLIDRIPPLLTIVFPENGATFTARRVTAVLRSEPDTAVEVRNAAFVTTARTDAQGSLSVIVPLRGGANTISAIATDDLGNIGEPQSVTVSYVGREILEISGRLSAPATLDIGQSLAVVAEVENTGTTDLGSVQFALSALDAASRSLATQTYDVPMPVGQRDGRTLNFDTASWPAGAVRLRLTARSTLSPLPITVADAQVVLRDVAPPTVEIVSPLAQAVVVAGDRVDVRAADQHSALAAVELQIDAGAWAPMAPRAGSSDRFELALPELSVGTHQLRARARDVASNSAETPLRPVIVRAALPLSLTSPPFDSAVPIGPTSLRGSTAAAARVELRRVGQPVENTQADASGAFLFVVTVIEGDNNRYELQAFDDSGGRSAPLPWRLRGIIPRSEPIPNDGGWWLLTLLILGAGLWHARRPS